MWWPGKINKDRTFELNKDLSDQATHYNLLGECSSNNTDWVYDVMGKSSIQNFVESLEARTPLLAHHDTKSIVGYSDSGEFKEQGDKFWAEGGFKVQRNWEYMGIDTEQFMKGVLGGSLLDLSVGAQIGKRMCGIEECGKEKPSFFAWLFGMIDDDDDQYCTEHIAGEEYDGVIATNVMEDCKLIEVSSVYSGACPDSGFLDKVCNMADMLKDVQVSATDIRNSWLYLPEIGGILETQFSEKQKAISFPESKSKEPEPDPSPTGKTGEGDDNVELEERVQELRNEAAKLSDTLPSDPVRGLEQFIKTAGEWKEELDKLQDEEVKNKHKVEKYDEVHEGLIKEALESGVKARGDDFDMTTWRGILEKSSFKEIGAYKKQWDKEHEGQAGPDGGKIQDSKNDGDKKKDSPEPGEYDGTFSLPSARAWVG